MRSVETRGDAVDRLRSGCEQCLSCLKELSRVQLEMDPHDRAIGAADDEMVYRLRKVLLHVKAITGWHLDTEVIHILAPELRAADEQIDQVWKKVPREELSEYLAKDGKTVRAGRDTMFRAGKEILSLYIHPTPQRLGLGKEVGGLGRPDKVLCFANLLMLLSGLVLRYGISLDFMSQRLSGGNERSIAAAILKASGAVGSASVADCLRFVTQNEEREGERTPGYAQ